MEICPAVLLSQKKERIHEQTIGQTPQIDTVPIPTILIPTKQRTDTNVLIFGGHKSQEGRQQLFISVPPFLFDILVGGKEGD